MAHREKFLFIKNSRLRLMVCGIVVRQYQNSTKKKYEKNLKKKRNVKGMKKND